MSSWIRHANIHWEVLHLFLTIILASCLFFLVYSLVDALCPIVHFIHVIFPPQNLWVLFDDFCVFVEFAVWSMSCFLDFIELSFCFCLVVHGVPFVLPVGWILVLHDFGSVLGCYYDLRWWQRLWFFLTFGVLCSHFVFAIAVTSCNLDQLPSGERCFVLSCVCSVVVGPCVDAPAWCFWLPLVAGFSGCVSGPHLSVYLASW